VGRATDPTRKQVGAVGESGRRYPDLDRFPRPGGDFESDRSLCFPLSNNSPGLGLATAGDVGHAQSQQIASTELAINGQIEQGEVTKIIEKVPGLLSPSENKPGTFL